MKNTTLLERKAPTSQPSEKFSPLRICEIEISKPLPDIATVNEQSGQQYLRAQCLIRLHTQPLGTVELSLDALGAKAEVYAECIWQALGEQINAHLCKDGLPEVTGLDVAGLPSRKTPKCVEEREAFLQTAPFASVVISTRDRPVALARCLSSLLTLHYPRYEVIVVDNAPFTSATADFIQQTCADEPRVRYVREDRPGASSGRNRGIVEARGEIIAFTDDDVVVDTHWLSGLAMGFKVAENVACVTGLIVPLELETPAQFLFEAYSGFTRGFSLRIFDLREPRWKKPGYPYIVAACGTGASMAFTTRFLKSQGGFDPALGPGCLTRSGEDLVAFLRVIIQGYSLVYEPASLAYHEHRRNYTALQKQLYDYGVGFTAYLTKVIIDHPLLIFDWINKVVHYVFSLARARLSKPEGETIPFPQELKRLEWKGWLRGPLAYIQSRLACGWTCKGLALVQASANAARVKAVASSDQFLGVPS
jgi:glycosyltransferase involved in cell wall biosynthesis